MNQDLNSKYEVTYNLCVPLKPCPFGLRKWLDPVIVIFFKNAKKNTSSELIIYGLVIFTT